jgi:hypothetical protein
MKKTKSNFFHFALYFAFGVFAICLVCFALTYDFNQLLHPKDKIDTSEWRVYRNEELGFEFKCPKEWEIEENIKGFSPIFKTEKVVLGFQTYSNKEESVVNWVEKNDFFKLNQNKDYVAYGINDIQKFDNFYVYSGSASGGGFFETAITEKNGRIIVFAYSATSNFNKEEIKQKFLAVLSLLKF